MPEQFHFGPFKLLAPDGDLYKGKTRIRLQQHSLTVLLLLLERPGEVVTREEIRSRVWPNGTIVEFDHGINTAVNKLRSALADKAERPRYIETVSRRGYRFLAPIERTSLLLETEPPPRAAGGSTPESGILVSHYRLEKLIGSGATGLVYEALDLNLNRRVALKFLAESSAADANALERFHREARAISALDHPNICGVYEFGEHGGRRFLAMQLLEGETLAHRIEKGPLELDYLLQVALQVANGMEAAHARGIIHRDIKPANIFLTSPGQVKVLDFGLAKLAEAHDIVSSPDPIAGISEPGARMTLAGAVMGTAAYMSPEQIRGEQVDHRTDIFSFGLVLYEMATGRHPFWTASDPDVSKHLLRDRIPSPSELRQDLPTGLETLIEQAVEKDRSKRVASFSAVREVLEKLEWGARQVATERSAPYTWMKLAIPGLIVIITIAIWMSVSRRPISLASMSIVPVTSSPGLKEHVVLSPDGTRISFAWYEQGDNEDIFVQNLGSQTPVRLTSDPARDFSPAWSPDGRYLAFMRSRSGRASFYVVPAEGGPERKLGDLRTNPAPFCRALDWSPDGQHLAMVEWKPQAEGGPALFLVSARDGTRVRRLLSSKGEFLCAPAFSPDGATLAVIQGPDFRVSDIHIVPVGGGSERRITFDGRMIQGMSWGSGGASIVYSLRHSGPFGLRQVPLSGSPSRTLLETGNDVVDPHLSKSGDRLVFVRDMWDTNLWRVEGPQWTGPRSGPVKLIASTREESAVDISPDGQQLVFASARSGGFELWIASIDGSHLRRMTYFNGPETGYPRWSPDGKRIVFNSYPGGQPAIFIMQAGNGRPWRRTDGEMPFWSEDGTWIYFLSNHAGSRALWKIPADRGDPVKVTDIGATLLRTTDDGKDFLYEQDDSLWRRTRDGRTGELIAQDVPHGMWSPAKGGVCYLSYGLAASFNVNCVDLRSREVRRVASLGSWPKVYGPPGFAISPDGQWIFYQRADQLESNIMFSEAVPQ